MHNHAMRNIYLHPTAAYISNHGASAQPVAAGSRERAYLRDLAAQVAEVAAQSRHKEHEAVWYRHNRLEKTRPVYAIYPEVGWADLVPASELKLAEPFWRTHEWYLLHLLYRSRFLDDDFVIKPEVVSCVDYQVLNGDSGFPADVNRVEETGSYVVKPPLIDYRDIRRFRMPELVVDHESTAARFEYLTDVFDGILTVKKHFSVHFSANQPGGAARLRGSQQLLLDMYDAPEWLHQLMELLTQACIKLYREMESTGLLTPNTANHYVDSGGMGFTDELPKKVGGCKLSDLWGFGVAQEFSEVSPEMHDEFGIRYQARVLEMFGLNAYGCCEPYTRKFDILHKIPRLRRVSVSPWCDTRIAAEKLQDKGIFSWKPNPAIVLLEKDFERVKRYVRDVMKTAQDCVLEVFLKDIVRLDGGQPQRLADFCTFMRNEVGN